MPINDTQDTDSNLHKDKIAIIVSPYHGFGDVLFGIKTAKHLAKQYQAEIYLILQSYFNLLDLKLTS